MRIEKVTMGMPGVVEIIHDDPATAITTVFRHFGDVDRRFSPFKATSEVSRLNDGSLARSDVSDELATILALADETKVDTNGYFNVYHEGKLDPSGIVKGWAIHRAGRLLTKLGFTNWYVEVAGDIQVNGQNAEGKPWQIGIRNPLNNQEIVKVVVLSNQGIATSGVAERGEHIYNPHSGEAANELLSMTIIGPNVYEADRYATAAFAMGLQGVQFIEALPGFEAYAIDPTSVATMTSGFETYVVK